MLPLASRKGFTLLEILVVVGILSVVAIGLLAALDPLEQLRKGRDASRRNLATALIQAINRYNLAYGSWPYTLPEKEKWTNEATQPTGFFNRLEEAREQKTGFGEENYATVMYIATDASGNPRVCFLPEAEVNRQSTLMKYDDTFGTISCTGDPRICYLCIN